MSSESDSTSFPSDFGGETPNPMPALGGKSKAAGEWTCDPGRAMVQATVQAAVQKARLGTAALGGGREHDHAVDITEALAKKVSTALAMRADRLEVLTGGAGMELPFPDKPVCRMLVLGFSGDGSLIEVQDLWDKDPSAGR